MPHRPAPTSYQTLLDVSRLLLSTVSLEELLDAITRELQKLVPFDGLTIYRVDPVARMLVPMHALDIYADEIMDAPMSVENGITGWVVQHGVPQNVPQAHLDPRIDVVPGTSEDDREALASVPFVVRGAVTGALNLYRLGDDVAFRDEEFELICRFADLAALAIDHAQSRERLLDEAQSDWLTGLRNHRFFQEHLRAEVERAGRYGRPLSLVAFDLDDFKLLNDVYGHQEGDLVLRRVAAAAREELRAADVACRVGGEEFAIVLPETDRRAAFAVARRLCARVRRLPAPRAVTLSCGVAAYPDDAGAPADLVAAADAALYAAKAAGKDRAVRFSARTGAKRAGAAGVGHHESLSQLRLLGNLATKLNRLDDPVAIGETVVAELRRLVDHDNVRVFRVAGDSVTLEPLAHAAAAAAYRDESLAILRTRVGVGITGEAVRLGRALNVGDAAASALAVQVPGTEPLEESVLAVPMRHAGATVGAIVISRLGRNRFSPANVRLLEILAAQAAVALANAERAVRDRLGARTAAALRALAADAAAGRAPCTVARRLARSACDLAGGTGAAVVTGGRLAACHGDESVRVLALAAARRAPAPAADPVVLARTDLAAVPAGAAATAALLVAGHPGGAIVVAGEAFADGAREAVAALALQAGLVLPAAAGRAAAAR